MEKQDIINYVLETPTNTNPAILGQMLDSIEGEGGGGSSDKILLYEGDITTTMTYSSMGGIAYSGVIPSNILIGYNVNSVYLTIDGVSYTLNQSSSNIARGTKFYGTDKRNNSNYPFFEEGDCPAGVCCMDGYYGQADSIFTGEAETYSVKIEIDK